MYLTAEEEKVLDGERGEALAFAMKVLVNLGDLEEADSLIPIRSAHVSGVSYHTAGEALIKLLEDLVEKGAKASVPASLNPAGMDLERWEEIGYPEKFASKQLRIIDLFSELGIKITCSCIPYETPHDVTPIRFGDHLSWGESNAVIYANSVVGARTNREGGISSLASVVLGKTPNWGMHLEENRIPKISVEVTGRMEHHHFDLLGAYVGKNFNSTVAHFSGIPMEDIDNGDLKHLGASLAAKGGHPLFHLEGVTPETELYLKARARRGITDWLRVSPEDLDARREELYPSPEKDIDVFVLGCPQFGGAEFSRLHKAIKGKKLSSGKRIIVYTSRALLERMDRRLIEDIKKAGVEIYRDTCMVVTPLRDLDIERVGTDSGKAAHYIPKMSHVETGIYPMEMIVDMATRN